jgi:hypothetical protein
MVDFGRRYSNQYFYMMGVTGCVHKLNFRIFYSAQLGESSLAHWVFATTTAVSSRSRAKYLVDEVLEQIENIIINYTYHKLL